MLLVGRRLTAAWRRPLCLPTLTHPTFASWSGSGGGGGKSGSGGGDGDGPETSGDEGGMGEIVSGGDGDIPSALSKISIGENAPRPPHLLCVPIQRRPLFPGFMAPLVINDEALVTSLVEIKKTPSPWVGVFLVNDPNLDLTVDKFQLTRLDQIHRVGTLAHIQQLEAGPGGAIAMLMSHRRIVIKEAVTLKTPPLVVRVSHISQQPLDSVNTDTVKAMSNEILSTLRDIIRVNPLFQQHVSYFARRIDVTNPYALADFAASLTTADAKELQVRGGGSGGWGRCDARTCFGCSMIFLGRGSKPPFILRSRDMRCGDVSY